MICCTDCQRAPATYRVISEIINVPVCEICIVRAREIVQRSWMNREGRIRIEKIELGTGEV